MLPDNWESKRPRLNAQMNFEGHDIEVSKRFSESTRAGQGAGYLNSGEIDKSTGIEIAIACLFAPIRLAQEGATEDEIKDTIAASRTSFEHYMNLAHMRCKGRSSERGATAKLQPTEATPVEQTSKQADKPPSPHLETNTDDDGLDIDNEVL